jgi:predicted MFS family arabinose efflux permease
VLAALHRTAPDLDGVRGLTAAEWDEALDYCDRARLSLVLDSVARDILPASIRARLDERAAKNAVRLRQFEELYRELHATLADAGLDFVALKGLTHDGVPGRVQYDIDLYLPEAIVTAAQQALLTAGWTPLPGMESFPTDHLPAMLRRTDWKWRGDYFDPELPIAVELHFRFWNETTERIAAPGVDAFWERRVRRNIAGVELGALCPVDALAYASLHLLRHVFQGSVFAFHVYEIARMLETREHDEAFWSEWRATHPPGLQRLQAASFRLAREWFGCVAPAADLLPAAAHAWFEEFALSPATQQFRPNKDHLWLQVSLLDSTADKWSVIRLRLAPGNLPPRAGVARTGRRAYLTYSATRLRHHAVSLPRTALSGLRLWRRVEGLGPQFWRFLASAALFNFSLFIFFLHYNLFLLGLGFHEDFVGAVNSAMRVGSMAGTLPGAFVAQRFGLRRALLGTILCTAAAECLRAIVGTRFPLTALALLSGAIFSVWAVIMAPVIAGVVKKERRAGAFSVFFACMFAVGIAGNWAGGMLPTWIHSRRTLLLLSAAFSAVGLLPALGLRDLPRAPVGTRVYPRSRFLVLYLVPFALWHLGTGAFNPFNNVYFKHLGFADRRIGSVFAASQALQVGVLLLAPAIIRRAGLIAAIASMMAATAVCLGALASQPAAGAAVAAYAAYMSFQWMSEPGLNTLLMNGVAERERSGASALNYIVAFGAQAVAALAAGAIVTRFGYGPMLAGAAALAMLAAGIFPVLLRSRAGSAPE